MRPGREAWVWLAVALVLGLAGRIDGLALGFSADDFALLAMVDGTHPATRPAWDLFNFTGRSDAEFLSLRARGAFPWWSDDGLRFSAMRPLSSLLFAADVFLFGTDAWTHHLHSALWWVVLVMVSGGVLREALGVRWGGVALVAFAVANCHDLPLGWLANRGALVAAASTHGALWLLMRHGHDGDRRKWVFAILLVAAALCAGEYAYCGLALVLAWVTLAPHGGDRVRLGFPFVVLAVAGVGLHAAFGFGVRGSGLYIDPFGEFSDFAASGAIRWLVLLADLTLGLSSDIANYDEHARLVRAIVGAGSAAVGIGLLFLCLREPRVWRWWLVGTLIACVPVLPAPSSTRLLVSAQLGFSAMAGLLLRALWERRRALGVAVVTAGVVSHVVMPLQRSVTGLAALRASTRAPLRRLRAGAFRGADHVVVLAAADWTTSFLAPYVWAAYGRAWPRTWTVLTGPAHAIEVFRLQRDAVEIRATAGPLLDASLTQMFRRRDRRLGTGDRVRTDSADIRVLEDGPLGPTGIRVEFRIDLSADTTAVLMGTALGLVRVPLPDVGGRVTLPAPAAPS